MQDTRVSDASTIVDSSAIEKQSTIFNPIQNNVVDPKLPKTLARGHNFLEGSRGENLDVSKRKVRGVVVPNMIVNEVEKFASDNSEIINKESEQKTQQQKLNDQLETIRNNFYGSSSNISEATETSKSYAIGSIPNFIEKKLNDQNEPPSILSQKDAFVKDYAAGLIPNFASKNAYVFDFDDTLAVTEAKSFKDFSDPSFVESAQATRYASLAKRRSRLGDDIHVLTARIGSKGINSAISNFMQKVGAPAKSVIGVAGMFKGETEPGAKPGKTRKMGTSGKKQKVLSRLAKQYAAITFLDDSKENVLRAEKVAGVKAVQAQKSKLFKAMGFLPNFIDTEEIRNIKENNTEKENLNLVSETQKAFASSFIPNYALSDSMMEGLRAKLRPGSGATDAEKRTAKKILEKDNENIKDFAILENSKYTRKQVQGAIRDVIIKRNDLQLDPEPIEVDRSEEVNFANEYIKKVNKTKRAFTNEKLLGTTLTTNEVSLALKGQGAYQRGKYIPTRAQNMADGFIPNFFDVYRGIRVNKGSRLPSSAGVFQPAPDSRGSFRASSVYDLNSLHEYLQGHVDSAIGTGMVSSSTNINHSKKFATTNRSNEQGVIAKKSMSHKRIYNPKKVEKLVNFLIDRKGWTEAKAVQWFVSQAKNKDIGFHMKRFMDEMQFKVHAAEDEVGILTKSSFAKKDSLAPFADGFIPNFANEVQEAIVREKEVLKSQGSSAKIYVDKDKRLETPKNPLGLLVANRRDEPSGGFQGVNRVLSGGLDPKTHGMASGYIPNFAAPGALPLLNPDQLKAAKQQQQANIKLADSARTVTGDLGGQKKATEEIGTASNDSMGKLLAFQIGLSTIESTLVQTGLASENFSLQATQAGIAVGELGGNLGKGLGDKLSKMDGPIAMVGKTISKAVPAFGFLSAAVGAGIDIYNSGVLKSVGFYNVQQDIINSTGKYTKALEEQQNIQAQSIEKIDKFSVTLASLSKAAKEGNIDAYGKFLKNLTEQAGNLDNLDADAFRELLESAGDAKKLNEATQKLKDLINQGSQLTNFQKDFASLTKEIAEADGDLDKVNAGKKIKDIGKTLVSSLNLDQMKELGSELADFDSSSQDSTDTLLRLQSVFGDLDSETINYIKQNEELSKSLLLSIKSQAGYKVAADALTNAYIKARSPIQNLNTEFSKLALAIDNSVKNIRAAFGTLSEVGKIEAESRTKTLEATSVVTPQASAQGQALAELARAQKEASQEINTSLQSFASETIKSAEKNSQVLEGPIKTLVEGIQSGDVNLNAAVSALREIQQTGNAEQKDAATKTLDTIRGANQEFISSQKVIDATLRSQLQESAIQSAIFRRENQLSESQLKTLTEFNNSSKTNLERLEGLKGSIDLVADLGGSEEILAELKAGNRQRSELENLEAAFSKFTGEAFDAINLDDLENQVDSFIASDRFAELDNKTQSLVAALTGAFDKINQFDLQDKGVSSAQEVGAAKTISTPDEAIRSLATEFETFSQTLATGLKLDSESIKTLSSTESIQSIADTIRTTSETNQQNLDKNLELQKAQTDALITAATKMDSSGDKLDNAATALIEAARAIQKISGTSASGFVPSFSPNSQAVTRAIKTERNLGGKPVVDYHSTIGTYVRDANTQPNFAAVKRDHPEGLNRAAKNSKTLQGMAASRGFVPNFIGSYGGFTGTGGNFNESFEPSAEQKVDLNAKKAQEAIKQRGYEDVFGTAILGNFGAFDKSLFLGSSIKLPFDKAPWGKLLNTKEYAKKFYNSVYNFDQPSFNGADKVYTESTKQSFENLQKSFFQSMGKESKPGNLWDGVLKNKTTARTEFEKYFNQKQQLFTNFDLSKDAYYKNLNKTYSPKYNLQDQINNAYLHDAIGTVAGPIDIMPQPKAGLQNPYTFKVPVNNGSSLAYVPAVTSFYRQNQAGDYSRTPGFAKHVLLKNVADQIQNIHYGDDLVVPNDIKYNLKNEQADTIPPTSFLDIEVATGRKATSSIAAEENKISQLDTLERVIQNKISANDQYIEKKKGDLYMLKNPLIDPSTGLASRPALGDDIQKLESHIKDVQDQKTIFQSQINKHKVAKEYIQKNLEYAKQYKAMPSEQFASNPLYLNDSGRPQKLQSYSSNERNNSINNLSTWFSSLNNKSIDEKQFQPLINTFKEQVFNQEFNKYNSEAKALIDSAYNSLLPTALKNLSLTPKQDYSQVIEKTTDEIKNYKLKSPEIVKALESAKTEEQKKSIEKGVKSSAESQLQFDTRDEESYSQDLFPQTINLGKAEQIIQAPEKSNELLDLFHNAILGRSIESQYADANANVVEIAEKFAQQKSMAQQATSNKKAFIQNQIKGRKTVLPRYQKLAGDKKTSQQKKYAERAEIIKKEIEAIEKHASIYDNSDAIKYIMFEDMGNPLLMDNKPIYPIIPTAPEDYAQRFERYEKIFDQTKQYKDSGNFLKLNPNNQFANESWSEDYARIHTGTFLDQFAQQNYDQRIETLKKLGVDTKVRQEDDPLGAQEEGRSLFLENLKNSASNLPEKYLYDRINSVISDASNNFENFAPTFKKLQTIGMPLLPNEATDYIPQIKLISAERIDGGPGTQEYSGPIVSEDLMQRVMTQVAGLQQTAFFEKNKKFYEDAGIKLLPEMLAGKKIEFNKYPQYLDWLAEKSGSGFTVDSFVNQTLSDTEGVENFESWRNKYISNDFTDSKSTIKRLSLGENYGPINTSDPILQKNEVVKRFFQAEEINPFAFIDGENTTPFGALKFAMGEKLKHGKNVKFEEHLKDTSDPLAALGVPKLEGVSAENFISNAYQKAQTFKKVYAPLGYTKEHAVDSPRGAAASDPDIVTRLEEALNTYKIQQTNEENRARGFVPNFSAVAGEIIASKAAGYNTPVTSSQVKTMSIPGVGKTAYNTQESVFKLPGMTQPFITPPSNSDAAEPYKKEVQKKFNFNPYQKTAADGFIPNFAKGVDFSDFESAVSAFSSVTDGFGKHISSFGKVISSLDFKQFTTASSEIQQAAKTFSAQSDNFKQAAEKIRSSADKFSSQSAQAPQINLGGLDSAVTKFSGGITRLSNKLDKKLQVDAGGINTAVEKLTTALGKIQGSIQVKIPDVNVNVQGNVSSTVSAAIKSEIPIAVKNALDSANIEGLVEKKIREFMR